MTTHDLEALTKAYLEAVDAKDMARCVAFYADDGTILFQDGTYQGTEQINEWHQERANANFRILEIEKVTRDGDLVTIDAVVTSDRLTAWRIKSLSGRATVRFTGDKIQEMNFSMRVYNPLEGW